ncbi:MAG TPA: hypothetical protein VMU55_08130 [Solirubrobacteraceae bacterium]|nr:hypothetical protein [Solirubrobacteraceae bacterium]
MTYTVTVAPRANPRVKTLRGKAKDKFWDAINRLEHEGCIAGHYRMRAPDGSDAHVCGLRFYADWRMHIVFAENNEIVVSWGGQHTDKENPHIDGATDVPELADIGRTRTDQPPCCDEPDKAPIDQKLVDRINALRPPRHK